MAVSTFNPYGAVNILEGGTPRVMTVLARANISGGYWVAGSSAAGVVVSGADSYAASDIEGYPLTGTGSNCIGLALQDIPSGTYGPVAQRGVFILPVGSATLLGSVLAGHKVHHAGYGRVIGGSGGGFDADSNTEVGRAISTGGGINAQFVAVSLNI